jgi:hypothetical protein
MVYLIGVMYWSISDVDMVGIEIYEVIGSKVKPSFKFTA